MAVASKFLLRKTPRGAEDGPVPETQFGAVSMDRRQYIVSFTVPAGSPIIAHTVATSGITTAKDVSFVSVRRGKSTLPFHGDLVLEANDEYAFALVSVLFPEGNP
jgi:Trk K+ transport system NAD-binding subunit